MKNPLIEAQYKARPNYVHALEVHSVEELKSIIDQIIEEYNRFFVRPLILDFVETMEIYALNDENEEEIYNFDFRQYTKNKLEE